MGYVVAFVIVALLFGLGSAIAAVGAVLGIVITIFFVIALACYAIVEWWRS